MWLDVIWVRLKSARRFPAYSSQAVALATFCAQSSFPSGYPLAHCKYRHISPLRFSAWQWWVYATGWQEEEDSKTWQGYYLCVVSWSSLNANVFWSFTKRSVWRKVEFGKKLFQTKLLSHLSHKVCRLLSFPVLLHKFSSAWWVPLTGLSWLPSMLAGGSPYSSLVNRYKEL